jgi:outer membrane protein assembly factor BamB
MGRYGRLNITVAALLAAVLAATAAGGRLKAGAAPLPAPLWPTYHFNAARTGFDPSGPIRAQILQGWSVRNLDGAVFAEPLVIGSTVIAVTENDTIYALDSATGRELWHNHIATPVPLGLVHSLGGSLGVNCGNIDPLGITGTPVYDAANNELFVVAEVETTLGGVAHQLFGLDVGSGSAMLRGVSVDVPAIDQAHVVAEQQRGALALGNGRIYVAYGGLEGDCGPYHGWLVSVTENGTGLVDFQVPTHREGGIWATAGPSIDGAGNVYAAVGNGDQTNPNGSYDDSDSVLKLSPTLSLLGLFAPSTWASDNAGDLDLGSTGPTLIKGLEFQVGKSGTGYLINPATLTGVSIGAQLASHSVCASFGGTAQLNADAFVPCTDGIRDVTVGTNDFTVKWHASVHANGPPIVAFNLVWSIDTSGGTLYGLDPTTGTVAFNAPVGSVQHFSTPTASGNLLLVPTAAGLQSFQNIPTPLGPYHSLTPTRLLDTRSNRPLGPNSALDLQVGGQAGIPTNATAVLINVTATDTTAASFLTVYPASTAQPNTSNLNFVAGETRANLVEVGLGTSGQITVYNSAGDVDLVVDVQGYVGPSSNSAGRFNATSPVRLLDTRTLQPLGAQMVESLRVVGQGQIPQTGVSAVVINLTVSGPTAASFMTVYADGESRPQTSNLNFVGGQTIANRVVAPVGADGTIDIYNNAGRADVIVDATGWMTDATVAGGAVLTAPVPTRILDTRTCGSALGPGAVMNLPIAGATRPVPAGATAVVVNVTVTDTTAPSFLTVYPGQAGLPLASDINWLPDQTVPNLAIAKIGADGSINLFNDRGTTDVVVDVLGWYQ